MLSFLEQKVTLYKNGSFTANYTAWRQLRKHEQERDKKCYIGVLEVILFLPSSILLLG